MHALFSLVLLSTVFYLNFSSRIILAPLLPEIEQTLGLSHGQGGLFFLCISCGYFLALSGSGFVSARLHHRATIVLSLALIAAALFGAATSRHLLVLRTWFFFLGLASGLYLPSAVATISALFPKNQWGRAFAVHEVAPNLAFLSAPLLVALLLPTLGWRPLLRLLATILLLTAGCYQLFGSGRSLPGTAPNLHHCRTLLTTRTFWFMVLLFSMGISGTLGIYSVLPTYLVAAHHFTATSANTLVGLSRSTTLITALLGGWLADRYGNRQTMALVLLITGLATALLGVGPARLIRVWVWLQPLVAVCFFPAGFALLARIGEPRQRNLVISLVIPLAFVIGGGLVPAIITRLADFGLFGPGLALAGCFIGWGAPLLWWRLGHRRPTPG